MTCHVLDVTSAALWPTCTPTDSSMVAVAVEAALDGEGRCRVSDIALAGLGDGYRERLSLDDVRYLSPSRCSARSSAQDDVYSLALILFEAATGTTPSTGRPSRSSFEAVSTRRCPFALSWARSTCCWPRRPCRSAASSRRRSVRQSTEHSTHDSAPLIVAAGAWRRADSPNASRR